MKLLLTVFFIISHKEKIQLLIILFLMMMYMLLELASIGSLIPLITVLTGSISELSLVENSFLLKIFNNLKSIDIKNLLFLVLAIFLLKNLFIFFFNFIQGIVIFKIRKRLVYDLYQRYLNQNFIYFANKNSSEIQRNISVAQNFSTVLLSFLNLILEILVLLGLSLFILLYNFKIALIIVSSFLSMMLIIYFFTKKKLFELGKKSQNYDHLIRKNINENVANIKEIKLYHRENFFLSLLSKINNSLILIDFKIDIFQQLPRILIELISVFLLCLLIFNNLNLNTYSELVTLVAAYVAVMLRLMPSSTRVSAALQRIKFYSSQIYLLNDELKLNFTKKPNYIIKENKKLVFESFKLKNIKFRYTNSNYLIKNLNLNLKKGTINCIVGDNGSGKSTLINIILGLLQPNFGKILINDSEKIYKEFKLNFNKIGYVPQSIYLFDDTIENNIIFGDNFFNKNNFDHATSVTQLNKFVHILPDKYQTVVGERGAKLSGGQVQKIAIARCLYRDPDFIVLDEFNNNLDKKSETKILKFLRYYKNNKIIIIITHKKETYKYFDNIYLFKNKKLFKVKNN